ncbi:uncharacterized protein LOC121902480 isoform X3 [Scomber scombrus]|uniref:Uncharacterized protein LOC121902480 isoform X3 n=1 Tax=Scomber scombrus TaxID=13677 RepID=A0AAV1PBS0_SCOSC
MENYDETFHDVLTGANWEYQDPSLEKLMLELFGDIFLPNNSDEHAAVQTPQTPPTPPTPPNPPTPTFPADQNNLCQTQQEAGLSMSAQIGAHAQTFEPVYNVPRVAASTLPAAPPPQNNNVPDVQFPGVVPENLRPCGFVNGQVVYELPTHLAPLILNGTIQHQREERCYIKKPANAFMLFRNEQRHNIVQEYNITNSAMVNKILGEKWKSLSKEEQAKYYDEAERERMLHSLQHPQWSAKDNYGKNKKRKRASFESTEAEQATDSRQKPRMPATWQQTMTAATAQPSQHPNITQPHTPQTYTTQPSIMHPNITQPHIPQTYTTQPSIMHPNITQPHIPQTYTTQPSIMHPNITQPHIPQTYTTQASMMHPDITQPHISQTYTTQPSMTHPNVTQPHISQTYTTQPFMTHPNITQPQISQTYTTQPFMTHPNITQPHISQTYTTQPFMTHPNITQPHISQAYTTQPFMTHPNITQPQISQTYTTQPHMTHSNMTRPHVPQYSTTHPYITALHATSYPWHDIDIGYSTDSDSYSDSF